MSLPHILAATILSLQPAWVNVEADKIAATTDAAANDRIIIDWRPRDADIRPFDAEDCTMYRWRMSEEGLVYVSKDGAPEHVPTLGSDDALAMERVIARWHDLTSRIADRWGLPSEWLLAMVWRESNGNPLAIRHEANGWTGVGLMQITHPSLKCGLSDVQLCDPETNLEIGARYIARQLIPRYERNFPKISAAYNAGSVRPSTENEWNMHCTGRHVDAEVGALNYQILRAREVAAETVALQFEPRDMTDFTPHRDRETT